MSFFTINASSSLILHRTPPILTLTHPQVYLCQKPALVFSVVPSDRERLQTDEAVGVLRQCDGIPIQSHLVHVGPDVVTGVAFAECLICYF